MKIRTISGGISIAQPLNTKKILRMMNFLNEAKQEFINRGFEVQTLRLVTQNWEKYFQDEQQMFVVLQNIQKMCEDNNIDYFSIGTTENHKNIPLIYELLKTANRCFATTYICNNKKINYQSIISTAELIKKLAFLEPEGFANLRFAAIFNMKAGTPFFPAAYHKGAPSFAIGTENSDLCMRAFDKAKNIYDAQHELKTIFMHTVKPIETIGEEIAKKHNIKFNGIDLSIAPSEHKNESIAFAFEKLGLGKFGEAGTLAIARTITHTLKNLQIKSCGYNGLMLPVLEDFGLAQRNNEDCFNLANLLLYSSVCGTGLDTIPISGEVTVEKITAILLDIAALSIKLDKPLSARLMPIPDKKEGEMTNLNFAFFVNTKIMKV